MNVIAKWARSHGLALDWRIRQHSSGNGGNNGQHAEYGLDPNDCLASCRLVDAGSYRRVPEAGGPAQQELYEDAQQRALAWTRRRQEALQTGIDALKRMSACNTPVAMVTIYGEWLSGSLSRILADIDDAQGHALKMVEHLQRTSKVVLEHARTDAAATLSTMPVGQPPVTVAEPVAPQPSLREAAD